MPTHKCDVCKGTGYFYGGLCGYCNGTGLASTHRWLLIPTIFVTTCIFLLALVWIFA